MINELLDSYFIKNSEEGEWNDAAVMFPGLRILTVDGFANRGKAVNVFNEQWIDGQEEDFLISSDNGKVVRENTDLTITFIVHSRYANGTIDVEKTHDDFIEFMTSTDVWVASKYSSNKSAHCVCLNEYKPTVRKLKRGWNSWIMGTLTMHMLDMYTDGQSESTVGVYIGFGGNTLVSVSQITTLHNVKSLNLVDAYGYYDIKKQQGTTMYLWFCSTQAVKSISGSASMWQAPITIGAYKCYRSSEILVGDSYSLFVTT